MLFPVGTRLILLGSNSLNLFAELRLTLQILLLLGTKTFKVLLMALVNNSAGGFEALPYLFAKFLADRTNLAILLMQLLQLVEGTDNILFVSQFLCSLT